MRNRITFAFVVVGLLLSALPASAQKDRPRQRTQTDSGQQAVSRPQGGARLPVVRTDRSWRRAGIGTFGRGGYGGGYYDGYYGMSWGSLGREVLGAAIVGGMMGLASRHQNDVVVVQQPVTYMNPATGQPIPAVYQPSASVAQPQPVAWKVFRNRFEGLEVRVHVVGDNPEEYISVPAGGEVSKQLPSDVKIWEEVMMWKGSRQVPTQELGKRELPYHSGWVFFNPAKGEL